MKLSDLFARVNAALSNSGYVTWTTSFLQDAYSEGVTVVMTALPIANPVTRDLPLVAGVHQPLAADVCALMRPICNTTSGGVAKSHVAERGMMTLYFDELAMFDGLNFPVLTYQVQRTYEDPLDPNAFYVLPPVPAGYTGLLRSRVSVRPAEPDWTVALDTLVFPLQPGFEVAVVEHMLYRAFGRADENSPDFVRAQTHIALRDAELKRLGNLLGVPVVELQVAAKGTP